LILFMSLVVKDKNWVTNFLRNAYIFPFFPLFFKELMFLTKALFPYYLEPWIFETEYFFFDVYYKYFSFVQDWTWLTEIMSVSYLSYYFVVLIAAIAIYKQKGQKEFEFYFFRFCTTMFVCYILFILIPVRGPQHSAMLANPAALNGGFFRDLIISLQSRGSVVGAAFPSSHVAATWIAAFSFRVLDNKNWFRVAAFVTILLTISTFYLRYHYVVDAIFGFLLALLLEYLFNLYRRSREQAARASVAEPVSADVNA